MPSLEDLTTDQLLAYAKTQGEGNALFQTLLNSPDTRDATLRLVKSKNPNLPIPELDTKMGMEARFEEEKQARIKLEEKMQMDQINARIDKERERVKKVHDLTDADMIEVEKIMTDKDAPIPHYDAAAKVLKAQKTLATPTTVSIAPPTYDMPEAKTWAKGIGNAAMLNKTATEMAYLAQAEFRGLKTA